MAEALSPLILFAHGAGAPSSSAWMRRWADRLGAVGQVVTFDYPYMQARRKAPDKLPVLVAAHRAALDRARREHGAARPVVLAGKSMGSRVGCHLAVELHAEGHPPAAVICFGYPLRSGATGALRDEVLRALRTPVLFLQGTRDPLCPLADLEALRPQLTAPHTLHVVESGDHSLEVRRRAQAAGPPPPAQTAADEAVLAAIRAFLVARGLAPSSS
jgi:predicted alpha/beta-hydrolase family hydrolase